MDDQQKGWGPGRDSVVQVPKKRGLSGAKGEKSLNETHFCYWVLPPLRLWAQQFPCLALLLTPYSQANL